MSSSSSSYHSSPQNPSQRRTPTTSKKYMTFPLNIIRNITPITSSPMATTSPPTNVIHHNAPTTTMDQSDDETINSTNSNPNMSLAIKPCENYSQYGVWLRKQFPCIITMRESFFVHSCLKIRTLDDILTFHEFTPQHWKDHLDKSFNTWIKSIIELVILWAATLETNEEISFSQYLELRDQMLPILQSIY